MTNYGFLSIIDYFQFSMNINFSNDDYANNDYFQW